MSFLLSISYKLYNIFGITTIAQKRVEKAKKCQKINEIFLMSFSLIM